MDGSISQNVGIGLYRVYVLGSSSEPLPYTFIITFNLLSSLSYSVL